MSDDDRRFEVEVDGAMKTARVPPQSVQAWMKSMDDDGIKFRSLPPAGAQQPPATKHHTGTTQDASGVGGDEDIPRFSPGPAPAPEMQPGRGDLDAFGGRGPVIDPVGPVEATGMAAAQGATGGVAKHVGAGSDAFRNWLKGKMGGIDPITNVGAQTSARGIGAPLKGYDDYLAQRQGRLDTGATQHPGKTLAANVVGSLPMGMVIPGFKAAPGAGMAKRAAAGAGNVATDTAIASGVSAMEAPPGQRLEAAGNAAQMAGPLSAMMRAPGMVRAGGEAARKGALKMMPEDVAPAAEKLTAVSAEGAAERASARQGARSLEPTQKKLRELIDESEELTDQVTNYGKVGLKRDPIARGMEADGILQHEDAIADEIATKVAGIKTQFAEMAPLAAPGSGAISLKKASTAVDNALAKIDRLGGDGAQDAADVFMELDNLKREIGRKVKSAGADSGASEELKEGYETLRKILENEQLWGPQAAAVQREINAAYTPWIRARAPYARGMLEPDSGLSGADPWGRSKPMADSAKLEGMLRGAGTEGANSAERQMRQGLESTRDLVTTLADKMDMPPEMQAKAARVSGAVDEFLNTFEQTSKNLDAARSAREVADAAPSIPFVPKLSTGINVAGAIEEKVAGSPTFRTLARGAGKLGATAEPIRKMAAVQSGRAGAAQAATRSTELALQDKQYGAMLAGKDSEQRGVAVSVLAQTDPSFRARQRARSEAEQEQER